ncbi:hypothetical protein M409DRAFT_61809 [Zasmidium cellare ATCC 36951]|uniref:Ubiquitin 3 binding protein But2 C-terminal domain-containing protein n=1 Tax=Zasmidium cellare ATCC 36951 TaxID=1080233 RepID=A0A6A6D4R1_ZASCE|nr:uncharacterized protein M409DRAFT_61809 [Zasmidium cellare ATCC 36951]KAF2173360.1 hypothetical protein M409DRAFT_61809 [Zasmidium cellare ATCC 36951]
MMFISALATAALAIGAVSAQECTADRRVYLSRFVGIGYNAEGLGNSKKGFDEVPWGSPDSAGTCLTTIIPNGLGCAIPVATTGAGTEQFALETRQVFHKLTETAVIPFDNGTVLYSVEIQLGAREIVGLPATFHGWVYMDFNTDCRIYSARAYANVPTSVLGLLFPNTPLPDLMAACKALPVGGQKREAIEFQA